MKSISKVQRTRSRHLSWSTANQVVRSLPLRELIFHRGNKPFSNEQRASFESIQTNALVHGKLILSSNRRAFPFPLVANWRGSAARNDSLRCPLGASLTKVREYLGTGWEESRGSMLSTIPQDVSLIRYAPT